ncbi:helix-turn-helix domain-containing protein [Streptomyces sp. NPDC088400]|uniref:helix-turn-helix domain-containing protein n=1 Tax=Streptomyces sp. NPDC088400 TaxID=3365861 RepID=UPI00380618AD
MKVNEFQASGYTIVGNHLAQHRELSATAIGLATHIQSLPEGSPVDIKTLTGKFPEGRDRIAAALRELEAYGYIERLRERTEGGWIVTRTISYNAPEATRARRAREAALANQDGRVTVERTPAERPQPPLPVAAADRPATEPPQSPGPETAPAPSAPPVGAISAPSGTATPPAVPPPLPQPHVHTPERERAAASLLADLRCDAPCLLLSERDVRRLAPAVAAWLERGAAPEAVRRTLTANLPSGLHHPAALLAHRLTALLPPPLPATPVTTTAARPDPLQNCDTCDRAYRAPEPGTCAGCAASDTPLAA